MPAPIKKIAFEKAEREAIVGRIQRYFVDELDSSIGNIPAEHREGFNEGWEHVVKRICDLAVRVAAERR